MLIYMRYLRNTLIKIIIQSFNLVHYFTELNSSKTSSLQNFHDDGESSRLDRFEETPIIEQTSEDHVILKDSFLDPERSLQEDLIFKDKDSPLPDKSVKTRSYRNLSRETMVEMFHQPVLDAEDSTGFECQTDDDLDPKELFSEVQIKSQDSDKPFEKNLLLEEHDSFCLLKEETSCFQTYKDFHSQCIIS